jgi:hypothetical protein
MVLDPADTLRAEEVPISPLAGTRSQSMQRLQIGLFGLAAMVLLVGLANIIKTNAAQNEARVVPEAAPTVAGAEARATDSDPLADAGLVPDMPDEQAEAGDAAPALQP